MKNTLIIQQSFGHDVFQDMMRLTIQRHMAYARAHRMDYWSINGEIHPELYPGGWGKIWLIKDALDRGYEYISWIDADAAIFDFEADLRDALKDKPFDIGACVHDADWFKELHIPKHMNVGVLYVRASDRSIKFINEWLASYPGDKRWMEQGAFNDMAENNKVVGVVDDKWNATVNVNMVDKLVVKGYHGVQPLINRFGLMRADMLEDHINFRI